MEKMELNKVFWKDKKVFLTGHTGFKGSWLSIWLSLKGARITGYSLKPPTEPSLFKLANVESLIYKSIIGDINNYPLLKSSILDAEPDIVIHMAAQPLVRESYKDPIETYQTNVMGTVYLFNAIRECKTVRAVVNVTTDKCYDNKEWVWGYRESEPLGGFDPYSSSKACSEIVTSAFTNSFFNKHDYSHHNVAIASARAGNVIGGGDWAKDRLVPDIIRSLINNDKIIIRNPHAIRPWQHVLEPLNGYLLLSQLLFEQGPKYSGAWNFGPNDTDTKPVEWIVQKMCEKWGENHLGYEIDNSQIHPHEAHYLKLDISKARKELNWLPRWNLDIALERIVEWARYYNKSNDVIEICNKQIMEYEMI